MMNDIPRRIAEQLGAATTQVEAAIRLLDEGATVPFIARYRKEATGGLDDAQLRLLEERLGYLRELEERRATVRKRIDEQGKLTPELDQAIAAADTKTVLEDLYLPYKPKRRTKAQIALEAGLGPLAEGLLEDPARDPETTAAAYVDPDSGVGDVKAALDGARQILMERFAEDAELSGELREFLWERGRLEARVLDGKEDAGAKFADYFDYSEDLRKLPSHRALALFRGRNEGILRLSLELPEDQADRPPARIRTRFGIRDQGRPADAWLLETARWTWKVKLYTRLEVDLMGRLREQAEEEAIRVFARNLRELLLAAPAGPRATIGLDPGLRTGVKVTVVDSTGKLTDAATIYPHVPKRRWDESIQVLATLAAKHGAKLVAIGNGTASRETDRLAADLIARHPELGLAKVMVSESGASVYSASETASEEFPDLDVSLRGAVSIARRLQDPLAELVKIDPKAIGVGQYQHDVSQTRLARTLNGVVEDCVNSVGVDVNTASAPLLTRVAGLTTGLARNLVDYRDQHGAFRNRRTLLEVPRLGPKAFEQCAGFLRIRDGDNPLDASAVHPEAYPVVERILAGSRRGVDRVIGDKGFLKSLRPQDYTDDRFGVPTVNDIIVELEKPGRDPRPEFRTAAFKEGVEDLADLQPGMQLEGVVTNVTNFGAFVDVGVHQDGLVHVSQLADRFVKDPHEEVKPGDIVQVKVLEVDLKRRRIALTRRLKEPARGRDERGAPSPASASTPNSDRSTRPRRPQSKPARHPETPATPATDGAMAEAFARAARR